MNECVERELRRAVGLSDMAALLAAGFTFPTAELANALADGSFMADWRGSVADALGVFSDASLGPNDEKLHMRCDEAFAAADVDAAALRREYSRMFLAPGAAVPVWPYESCFRHSALGIEGAPSILNTRVTNDVQRLMHEAGVAPADENREPCDSIFHELEFLAHMHACKAEALRVGNAPEADLWSARIVGFTASHVKTWMPSFMRQVSGQSRVAVYGALAELGLRYLVELEMETGEALVAEGGR